MILSHARLPIPTLPQIQNSLAPTEKVNQKLTSNMLDAFLKSRRQGISQHTLLFYQRCLSKAIGVELTPQGINSFLGSLDCGNGKHAYYRAIRALSNWLEKEGYIQSNPIKRVDTPKVSKKILPSVTLEQLDMLLTATDNLRDKTIISLLFDSGLRLAEIASIKANNIDWDSNTLKVIVKGNREAQACFTSHTATLLRELIHGHGDTLFGMKPRGIQDMLSRLSEQVGFPCNAHSFRRGFACNLHRKGLSTLSIMHLGRWSSLDMVLKYARSLTFDDCLESYQKVNRG